MRQHLRARLGQAVETLIALSLFAPLADEQALAFEPSEQRIERALVDSQPVIAKKLAERVAILLSPKSRQHGYD